MTAKKILIVDDETNVGLVIAESLEHLGDNYQIDTVTNGQDALTKIKNISYDLVLTDYRMPVMSGATLAQRIHAVSPKTKIVMMTSYGTKGLHDVVASLKLDGFVDKSLSVVEIHQTVKDVLMTTRDGADPYRSGEKTVPTNVSNLIQDLRHNTNAQCTMLLSMGGHPIEIAGATTDLDIASIGALVAANFMAAAELAKLLGNQSVFKSSSHEGPDYDIYARSVNKECLLVVIFGIGSKTGTVRYYTVKTVDALIPLLKETESNSNKINKSFANEIQNELDDLFGF